MGRGCPRECVCIAKSLYMLGGLPNKSQRSRTTSSLGQELACFFLSLPEQQGSRKEIDCNCFNDIALRTDREGKSVGGAGFVVVSVCVCGGGVTIYRGWGVGGINQDRLRRHPSFSKYLG